MNYIIFITEKTSGHITNMLTLANHLSKNYYKPYFIISGTEHEKNIMKDTDYEFSEFKNLMNLNNLLNTIKPICVIGSGGRFSYKIILLSKAKNINTLLLEPNYYPGLTNVILSTDGTKVLTPLNRYQKLYNCELIFFKNPVKDFKNNQIEEIKNRLNIKKNKKVLLILSGTNGIKSLNKLIFENLNKLLDNNFFIIWQKGTKYSNQYNIIKSNLLIYDYIKDLDDIINVADIILTAAGINTINELDKKNKNFIMYPLENSKYNHQFQNCLYYNNIISKNKYDLDEDILDLIIKKSNTIPYKNKENDYNTNNNYNNLIKIISQEKKIMKKSINYYILIKNIILSFFIYLKFNIFYYFEKSVNNLKENLKSNYIFYENIPDKLKYMIVTCEDNKFWNHNGFYHSFPIYCKLLMKQIITRKPYVFSGIYQQLIKNLYFKKSDNSFYNFCRKIFEYFMTTQIDWIYDKELILEYYFNCVLYIDYKNNDINYFGIVNICKNLFDKSIDNLDFFEITFICTSLVDPVVFHKEYKNNYICPYLKRKMKCIFDREYLSKIIDKKEYMESYAKINKY